MGKKPPNRPFFLGFRHPAVDDRATATVSELEFNVPFQHQHGYIRDDPRQEATRTEQLVTIAREVPEISWRTDRQTDMLIIILRHRCRGRSNEPYLILPSRRTSQHFGWHSFPVQL